MSRNGAFSAPDGDLAQQVVEELVSRGVVAGRYVDVRYQVDGRVPRYADAVAIFELEAASLGCSANRLEAWTALRPEQHGHCAVVGRESATLPRSLTSIAILNCKWASTAARSTKKKVLSVGGRPTRATL